MCGTRIGGSTVRKNGEGRTAGKLEARWTTKGETGRHSISVRTSRPLLLLDFPANCVSAGLTVCSSDCAFMHTATSTHRPLTRYRCTSSFLSFADHSVHILHALLRFRAINACRGNITTPFRQLQYVTAKLRAHSRALLVDTLRHACISVWELLVFLFFFTLIAFTST